MDTTVTFDDVDRWQRSVEERAARARALSGRLAGLTATARDRDGLIEVTVGASGVVTGLRLDDRVRDVPPAHLARAIMAVMGGAQSLLVDQVREAAAELLGAESAQAIVSSYALRLLPTSDGADGRR
ncbi:YbaB/EbfC family nucleoid-associated protein [Luedemannella flava]|uniref:YbaB/EbfC family nucleoid-associated protein n=1 Tax=Luedemannella flava TaxID=349316 RepID=UPI0031DD03C0